MEILATKQKLAVARQLNFIVRSINDFQLSNWDKRDSLLFNVVVQNEKDILFLVDYLLDTSSEIAVNDPSGLLVDCENLSHELMTRLENCTLAKAVDLISRTIIIFSTLLGFKHFIHDLSSKELLSAYFV